MKDAEGANLLASDLDHVLEHTRDLWEELRGERLFITGGTGFFGRWLLESLAWANHRLGLQVDAVVLSRNPDAFRARAPHLEARKCIRFHVGDVRSFRFPDGEFSHIIHAATQSSAELNGRDPGLMLQTIVDGTRRTLRFAESCDCSRLLFASSGAVYGEQPVSLSYMPESFSGGPATATPSAAYAEGKRVAELLCAIEASRCGLQVKIGRGFAFVGPYLPLNAHFAIGNFIRDAVNGGPIRVLGDGRPLRSYLYAADLAIWLWTLLVRGPAGRAFNVGSEDARSIAEIARIVGEKAGVPEVSIAGAPSSTPPPRYVPSTRRASCELGLETWINFEEAVGRTLAHAFRNRGASV